MRWGYVAGGAVLAAAVVIGLRVASNRGASTGLDIALSHLPPGYSATHGAIAFNPVTGTAHMADLVISRNGSVFLTAGMADVSGIGSLSGGMPTHIGHVTLRDAAYPPVVRHVDRIELDDIASANLRAVFDPAAYPGGKPASSDRLPLVGSADVYGLVMHVESHAPRTQAAPGKPAPEGALDTTVSHESLKDLAARQFATAPTSESFHRPEMWADLARAISGRQAVLEGVVVLLPGGTLHMDRAELAGYAGWKFQSETVTNLSFISTQPKGEVRLGTLTLTGVDGTRLLDRLGDFAADPATAATKISGAVRAHKVALRDMKVDFVKGPSATLDRLDATTDYVSEDFSSSAVILRSLNIVTTGRDIPPQAVDALQAFGMRDFSIDIDSAGSFDRASGHLVAKREDVALKNIGTLHITGELDRLPATMNDPQNAAAAMRGARLIRGELRWDDASLTRRLFHLAALRTGESDEALRATIALPLATLTAFFPDQPDVADQINAFLDGQHTLDVTFAPATPVTLADYTATATMEKAHLLGVRIHGN